MQNEQGSCRFVSISPAAKDISAFQKLSQTTPVIFFDKVTSFEAFDKFCIDDEGAVTIAAEEIIKKQQGKVPGLFGNPGLSITQKRIAAFQTIFKSNNRIAIWQLLIRFQALRHNIRCRSHFQKK